jgi:hypothetical protein
MLPISFVIGAAIGLAMWAVAYRRPKPAPSANTVA